MLDLEGKTSDLILSIKLTQLLSAYIISITDYVGEKLESYGKVLQCF